MTLEDRSNRSAGDRTWRIGTLILPFVCFAIGCGPDGLVQDPKNFMAIRHWSDLASVIKTFQRSTRGLSAAKADRWARKQARVWNPDAQLLRLEIAATTVTAGGPTRPSDVAVSVWLATFTNKARSRWIVVAVDGAGIVAAAESSEGALVDGWPAVEDWSFEPEEGGTLIGTSSWQFPAVWVVRGRLLDAKHGTEVSGSEKDRVEAQVTKLLRP